MNDLVIFAPNWLGDAVMALPAVDDMRRAMPNARIAVAARSSVAPLFRMAAGVDEVIALEKRLFHLNTGLSDRFGGALLLPNSLYSAMLAHRAAIPERWGYRTDCRGPLLTRAVERPSGLHQVEFYQHLIRALGFQSVPSAPRLSVSPEIRTVATALLRARGWDGASALAVIAPGAAYGGAKRWGSDAFAALSRSLVEDGVHVAMIGSSADARTADEVTKAFDATGTSRSRSAFHNLVGATDLSTLAGVLAISRALVTNDSGAMHLAAAVGTRVTALFGPTNERATRPLGDGHTVITGDAWCRPCMLRECPLDHRCMRSIEVAPVLAVARQSFIAALKGRATSF
jgi:heptosyltransferase-2